MTDFDTSIIQNKNAILPSFNIDLSSSLSECDKKYQYNPFDIKDLQLYNPIYKKLFHLETSNIEADKFSFQHELNLCNNQEVTDCSQEFVFKKPIFIKFSPLLDPLRYMVGKYKDDVSSLNNLPKFNDDNSISKLRDPNNSAYIDCFFNYLSHLLLKRHNFIHSLDFYGNYIGVQAKYKMNITDDLDYLEESIHYNEHIGKLFDVTIENSNASNNSRRNRDKLKISDSLKHNISIQSLPDLQIVNLDNLDMDLNMVYDKETRPLDDSASVTSDDSDDSDDSELNYSSEEDDEEEGSDDESSSIHSDEYFPSQDEDDENDLSSDDSCSLPESDNDNEQYAYIHNFPVNLICLERCDGTFDELLENETMNMEELNSALFQVNIILLTYQKAFHFTHNDLHTNNIMYSNTTKRFITYKFNNEYYKVPTFGRIFRIIDFGRSIYKFNKEIFCSDSFAKTGDASTQYNCEPFLDENKPRIDPNFSFDLCRLGCSIYDFVIEDDNNTSHFDDFQKIVYNWCLDDNNKNILYKRNGEERYPQFKLYKMIARNVHKHTPEEQLKNTFFSHYKTLVVNENDFIDIDSIPCYA